MFVDLLGILCSYSMVSISSWLSACFSLSLQSKLEDIRLEQEREAEKSIRLHFEMEQIIYCQDQIYRGALQKVREKEAEDEKKMKHGTISSSQSQDLQNSSMAEIFQHLNAYRQVSVWTHWNWVFGHLFPLCQRATLCLCIGCKSARGFRTTLSYSSRWTSGKWS